MVLLVGVALLGTITVLYMMSISGDHPVVVEPPTPPLVVAADDDSAAADDGIGENLEEGTAAVETTTPPIEVVTPAQHRRERPTPEVVPVVPYPPTPSTGEPSKLYVNSVPWAEVYLDGKLFQRTPIVGREIDPGRHEVRLVCGVCATKQEATVAFDVAPGETYRNTSFRFQR